MMNLFFGLLSFMVFVFLQALFINGINESMVEGMVLSGVKKWVNRNIKSEFWTKPITGCVRCMASFWGGIVTFLPTAFILFGFHWWETPLFIVDVVILVSVNFIVYKRLC